MEKTEIIKHVFEALSSISDGQIFLEGHGLGSESIDHAKEHLFYILESETEDFESMFHRLPFKCSLQDTEDRSH